MSVRAVFLDVGETLIDETGAWERWARWLNVPALTLFGVLGAAIERGDDHRSAFEVIRPGIDLEVERLAREAIGDSPAFLPADFYPDALACLRALSANGYWVGVAGNTGRDVEDFIQQHVCVDFVGSSACFGVEKPSPDYFAQLCQVSGVPAGEIAYVGDRLDNDVLPAAAAGMVAVHIRRGPWGYLHAEKPEMSAARLRIHSLDELLPSLTELR